MFYLFVVEDAERKLYLALERENSAVTMRQVIL